MKITVDIEVETSGVVTQTMINDFVTTLFLNTKQVTHNLDGWKLDGNVGKITFDNSENDKVVQRFVQY